ncbi:MAG: iron ABC transporter ATP-binding protein [Helicobacteraceae bacterium 4484_230]|nr:MAG: iron ABC transporter ATP-binding protein [Helicobacteraceae bacterium 4484_230]
MATITLKNITKSYGQNKVLDNVSLTVEAKERIVIFGPSGCGKTTLLRIIAGFVAPDSGTLFIEDEPVADSGVIIKTPQERNIGMVFQDLALWPHMSVKENIAFGLKAKGVSGAEREERIREMLELVDMSGYEKRKPSQLSGGEQQRVALARALVLEPKILLMDEPLSSLDAKLNIRLRKEILSLQQKLGFTLVYVTHNEDEASDIATRLIRMDFGNSI